MSHHCRSLILHCIDFRFGSAIKEYLETNQLRNNCDIVSIAGAAKNIAAPAKDADAELVLRQIEISKRLHEIKGVILMNHTDCGAYGGRKAFSSDEEERARHLDDMAKAADIIRAAHPDITIKSVLAKIDDAGTITFEPIS